MAAKYNFAGQSGPKCNLGTRRSAAFTLVEVMAAMMFLAIAIPAILGAIGASSRSSEAAERSSLAAQLAENQLGQYVMDQTSTTGASSSSSNGSGDFGPDFPGYRYEIKQEAWTVSADMTQYTIQVFFSVKGQERSISLTTLAGLATSNP